MKASEVVRLKDTVTQVLAGLQDIKNTLNLQWETKDAMELVLKSLRQEERRLLYQMDNNDQTVETYGRGNW